MPGTLDGIRVVDLTTVILGPWAAQTLGDMGADVIKIETPQGDVTRNMGPKKNAGMAAVFLSTNRNKRSVVLDLRTREGKDALLKIVDTADVFMHNMLCKGSPSTYFEDIRESSPSSSKIEKLFFYPRPRLVLEHMIKSPLVLALEI